MAKQRFIERPALAALLEEAARRPVVTVVAGAGYGKTHAVRAWLTRRGVHDRAAAPGLATDAPPPATAWIQLSERDNSPERFWENFTEGVAGISAASAARLRDAGFPETGRQFDRYFVIPRDEVDPLRPYVFVYDDFHALSDPRVLRFIERSIVTPFPNICSVIISRRDPAFPTLSLLALKSKGRLAEITQDDLRFTRREVERYLEAEGRRVDPETVDAICRDTEGWAFAVHLAALAADKEPGAVPAALRSNIFKLIDMEVMRGVDPDLRRFLIKASLLDHWAPDLLRELEGADGTGGGRAGGGADPRGGGPVTGAAAGLAGRMGELGAFVTFNGYLNSWMIHPLFLEYLQGLRGELSGAAAREVWTAAARWCAGHGRQIDALSYYEKAGDYDGVMRTLYAMPLLLPGRGAALVLEILDRAPPAVINAIPVIPVIRGRILISLGRFAQARAELEAALARLEPADTAAAGGGAVVDQPILRALMGCHINLGFVTLITARDTGDYDFPRRFEAGAAYSRRCGYVSGPPVSVQNLGSYACLVGRRPGEFGRFLDAVEASAPHVAAAMGGCMAGYPELARGEFALFRTEFAAAETWLLTALGKARERGQPEIENRALFYLLRIYLCLGRAASLARTRRELEACLTRPHYLNRVIHYDLETAWYHAQTGRPEEAAPWTRAEFEERDLRSTIRQLEILVKARLHFAEGRFPAALAALDAGGDLARDYEGSNVLGDVETRALEAACRYRLGDRDGAARALRSAREAGAPDGLLLPLAELGKDGRALAAAFIKDPVEGAPREWLERIGRAASAYAKKARLAAAGDDGDAADGGAGDGSHAALSRRERELLAGLAGGLTREELAASSSLSPNTVKSVLRSVYAKLGAVNRADAVRIAAERGLIAER